MFNAARYRAFLASSALLLLCHPITGRCQTSTDTVSALRGLPSLNISFERMVNTYLWNISGLYSTSGSPWRVTARERFLRTLIKTGRDLTRDEQNFSAEFETDLAPPLMATASVSSYIFSDNRSIALNSLTGNKLLAGVKWTPLEQFSLSPMAGYSFDNQQGSLDRGFMYTIDASLREMRLGDTRISAVAHAAAEDISPRTLEDHRLNGESATILGTSAGNRARVFLRRSRRDYYPGIADEAGNREIESRIEFSTGGADYVDYRLSRNLKIAASVDAMQRSISKRTIGADPTPERPVFDGNVDEFRLAGGGSIEYGSESGSTVRIRIEVGERSETHSIAKNSNVSDIVFSRQQRLEEQKNNNILQTQLSAQVLHPFSGSDTLSLAASAVKLVYDTPSSSNHDDRDELLFLAALRWTKRLNPWLLASLAGDAQLRHTVFIFGERSANNTWNRVFRISPSVAFHPGESFSSVNHAEVTANYTVYDFERISSPQPSFSLRQAVFADSTSIKISSTMRFEMQAQLRLYEQGEISWSAFTLRPLSFHDERSIMAVLRHRLRGFSCAAGFRLFRQARYRCEGRAKNLEATLNSYGPVGRAELTWRGVSLIADGWYPITEPTSASAGVPPNLSLRLLWNL